MAGSCEWHMWGDGPMRQELQSNYGDVVVFHGLVTDLGPVWPSIGLLVMPSRAEGLPMAALEALSSGVPLLASEVGDLPVLVQEDVSGWLVASGDLESACAAVGKWRSLDLERQTAMRRACWLTVREGFSEATHLGPILDAYAAAGLSGATSIHRAA